MINIKKYFAFFYFKILSVAFDNKRHRKQSTWSIVSNLIIVNFLAAGLSSPVQAGDSRVKYVPYDQIQQEMKNLAQIHPDLVEYVEYGTSVQGRRLSLLRIADVKAKRGSGLVPAIEISGAIHGNEYLGIELPLLKSLVENNNFMPGVQRLLAQGGVIYGIPVVNPDGYSQRIRNNDNDEDLNRDFDNIVEHKLRFFQPETKSLAQYIDGDLTKNGLNLDFSLDYHCCRPAMIIPWSYEDRLPEGIDLGLFKSLAAIQTSLLGFPWGNPAQVVGYTAMSSSMDYFYAKYQTLAVAIEGRNGGEKDHLKEHLSFIDQSLQKVVLDRGTQGANNLIQ